MQSDQNGSDSIDAILELLFKLFTNSYRQNYINNLKKEEEVRYILLSISEFAFLCMNISPVR